MLNMKADLILRINYFLKFKENGQTYFEIVDQFIVLMNNNTPIHIF